METPLRNNKFIYNYIKFILKNFIKKYLIEKNIKNELFKIFI